MGVLRMLKGAARRFAAGGGGTDVPADLPSRVQVQRAVSGDATLDFTGAVPPLVIAAGVWKEFTAAFAPGVTAADFAADGAKEVVAYDGTTRIGSLVLASFSHAQVTDLLGWIAAGTVLRVKEDFGGYYFVEPAP
jgi:hypothetical protein